MGDCGYASVILKKPIEYYTQHYGAKGGATYFMSLMLSSLQHRGQQSAGFVSYHPDRERRKLDGHKGVGLVKEVFGTSNGVFDHLMENYSGTRAIGHVRWGTSGGSKNLKESEDEAQPFYRRHGRTWKRFAFAWNGTVANYREVQKFLVDDVGYALDTHVDTELLMHLLAISLAQQSDLVQGKKPVLADVMKQVSSRVDGGYCLTFLNGDGDLAVLRDPRGFMPSCYGENEDFFAAASESVALTRLSLKTEHIRSHSPGELLLYDQSFHVARFAEEPEHTPCFFQLQYLAHRDSVLDGVHVEQYRRELGRELARLLREQSIDTRGFLVVPIPETSLPIAESLAQSLGTQSLELLRKIDAVRAYITPQDHRSLTLNLKYGRVPAHIRGRDIILVDDSIVRGDTAGALIHHLREYYEPGKVCFVSATPPLRYSCYYGADIGVFGTRKELVAAHHPDGTLEEKLAERWGVEKVVYMTPEGVRRVQESFGMKSRCMACVDGHYPTPQGRNLLEEALREP